MADENIPELYSPTIVHMDWKQTQELKKDV